METTQVNLLIKLMILRNSRMMVVENHSEVLGMLVKLVDGVAEVVEVVVVVAISEVAAVVEISEVDVVVVVEETSEVDEEAVAEEVVEVSEIVEVVAVGVEEVLVIEGVVVVEEVVVVEVSMAPKNLSGEMAKHLVQHHKTKRLHLIRYQTILYHRNFPIFI